MSNLFDLTGKTAIITGAGGLLGPKHAEALVEYGANVVMTDHHYDRAVEKAAYLNDKYKRECARAYHMDVTDKVSVSAVIEDVLKTEKIDILILSLIHIS